MGESADAAGVDADGVGLVDLVSADSLEQFGQRHPGFHPGQVGAEAEVRAAAETQEFRADFAADDDSRRDSSNTRSSRCAEPGSSSSTSPSGMVVSYSVSSPDDDAGQDLAGRVVAQRLLDPQRNPLEVVVDRGQLIGVLVTPERRVGKQFGGGLVAGDHHQEQEAEDLFVGEPVAVDLGLQQRRRQVVGELLAALRRPSPGSRRSG